MRPSWGAKMGPMNKLGPALVACHEEYQAYQQSGSLQPFEPADPLIRLIDERVAIEAVTLDDPATLLADLEAMGLQDASTYGRFVSGTLPLIALDELAACDSLKFAQPVAAMLNVGLVTSQGDAAMRSGRRHCQRRPACRHHRAAGRAGLRIGLGRRQCDDAAHPRCGAWFPPGR